MKNRIIYLFLFVIGIFTISSCERGTDVRKPDTPEACAVYVSRTADSDFFVDLNNLDGLNLAFEVNTLFEDPFQKIDFVVVYNNDYANQLVVKGDITSLPDAITVGISDLVSAIPTVNSKEDIQEGDSFEFFANVTLKNGTVMPAYSEEGTLKYSTGLRNALTALKNGAAFTELIPTPCGFDINNYIGTYDFHDVLYPSEDAPGTITIELDPDVENGIIITGVWPLSCDAAPFKAVFHPELLSISIEEDQFIADDIWGGGELTLPTHDGTFDTCSGELLLNIDICIAAWGCFGNPIRLTPSSK